MHQIKGPICFSYKNCKRSIVTINQQAFYRSSGHNSGMPGIWLPFDGIGVAQGLWFVKDQYTKNYSDPFFRFGTQKLKDISNWLNQQNIPEGQIIENPKEINLWINNKYTSILNEQLDKQTYSGKSQPFPTN